MREPPIHIHSRLQEKSDQNEPIVIDISSTYGGYFADITRTVAVGRGASNVKFERQYDSVLEAQKQAIEASKPGVTVGSVDAAARDLLRKDRLAEYFLTRTGHGLGLDIHEAPYIVPDGKEILTPRDGSHDRARSLHSRQFGDKNRG